MEEINRLHDIADDLDRTMWGQELADALHNIAAHIGEEVDRMRDLSGYESDVLAWVEKNGGLDAVKEQRRESIPRAAYERKKAGWLDHIEECEEALARRNGRISELRRERDKLRDEAAWAESLSEILDEWADLLGFPEQKGDPGKITARVGAVLDGTWRRLMPEGCEWPRYEDGEPVPLGGEVTVTVHDKDGDFDRTFAIRSIKYKESGVLLEGTKNEMVILSYGKRVKRPAVLAADGEPLEVGQKVWGVEDGKEFEVVNVNGELPLLKYGETAYTATEPEHLAHKRPALDADGAPIKKGDTVWHKGTGEKYRVFRFSAIENRVWGENDLGSFFLDCSMLTHAKPEPPDSWDSVWMDVSNGCETPQGMERRCKALAERGER